MFGIGRSVKKKAKKLGKSVKKVAKKAVKNPLAALNPSMYLGGSSIAGPAGALAGESGSDFADLGGSAAVAGSTLAAGAYGLGALGAAGSTGGLTLPELGMGSLGLGSLDFDGMKDLLGKGGAESGGSDIYDWLPALLGVASAASADYGAKDTLPEWIKPYKMDVLNRAQADVDTPYQGYEGEAIAPMSGNEQMAYDIAGQRGALHAAPGFDYMGEARRYADEGAQSFTDADMQQYMNPYIMAALDPAAEEMLKAYQLEQNRNRDLQVSRGAFGGSRGALLETGTTGEYLKRRGDLYKTGLSDAWTQGTSLWQNDRDAAARASGQYGSLAGVDQNIRNADMTALRDTGGLARGLDQAQDTFDYEQFREGRDWADTQLDQYGNRVAGVETGTEIQPADRTGAILGALATGVGMVGGGP